MWCEPFLSPPNMCRFFTKHMVMWATFQSIGLQDCENPVSSPTFCTVPSESWNTNARGMHSGTGAGNFYLYESGPFSAFLTVFCAIAEEQYIWIFGFLTIIVKLIKVTTVYCVVPQQLRKTLLKKLKKDRSQHLNKNCLLQSHCAFTSHLFQDHTYVLISRSRV